MFTRRYLVVTRPALWHASVPHVASRHWTRRGAERACLRHWARDGYLFPMRYRVTDAEA